MAALVMDVTRLITRALAARLPTGIDRVGLEYVRHFGPQSQAIVRLPGRWILASRHDSARIYEALVDARQSAPGQLIALVARIAALCWQRPASHSLLLNVLHSGFDAPGYTARARRWALRPVYFLHDLIPITHPEYARPHVPRQHAQRVQAMLEAGKAIIVNSEHTRAELVRYAELLRTPLPPTAVAPLAPAELPRPSTEAPLPGPYFVTLGTLEARKNHLLLLQLWRELAARQGKAAPRLVIIGQLGWESEQVADLLERCGAIRPLVIHKRQCNDGELASWLAHARALLFPSFVEGFGLPLVEALKMGVPVVASDLPVFREVAGSVPDFLSPIDGAGWLDAVTDYACDASPRRHAQLQRMSGWRAPTWQAHFTAVQNLLEAQFPGWDHAAS